MSVGPGATMPQLQRLGASSGGPHGASCVQEVKSEFFICAAEWHPSMSLVERPRQKMSSVRQGPAHPVMLVSSPGFAILDSGCGKTIVGANTLQSFREIWMKAGVPQPVARRGECLQVWKWCL